MRNRQRKGGRDYHHLQETFYIQSKYALNTFAKEMYSMATKTPINGPILELSCLDAKNLSYMVPVMGMISNK